LSRDGLPVGEKQWLFFRKNNDGKIKYAISNAPHDTTITELVKASVMRWPIEQCFQEGKGEVGMDCYEHRSWPAWHRHMIFVFLALHFLLRMRLRYKKNASTNGFACPQIDDINTATEVFKCTGHDGNCCLPSSAELNRLQVVQEEAAQVGEVV
jgi:hypothetical protein